MPPPKKPSLSVAQVLELPVSTQEQASWVNGIIGRVAGVDSKQSKAGQPFWNVTLLDISGSSEIDFASFSPPAFRVGDTIEITGTGARRTEYHGKAQLALSKNSNIRILGSNTHQGVAETPAAVKTPPRAQESPEQVAQQEADSKSLEAYEKAYVAKPDGMTVGCCLKLAVDIVIHNAGTGLVDLPSLQHNVEKIAPSLIAAAMRIQSGKVKIDTETDSVPY